LLECFRARWIDIPHIRVPSTKSNMSRSGVAVDPSCSEAFQQLKLSKSAKFIIFKINDDKTSIVVSKQSNDADYDTFLAELPENDCRYAVYDFEFSKGDEGKRNKICFYAWSPDTAPIKSKMVYASSKESIKRSFNGIGAEIQGTDYAEVSYDSVLEKVSKGRA